MTDVSISPSGRLPIGSSASWYGGPSRSTAANYEALNVILDEDLFGVGAAKVEEDMERVRVNFAGVTQGSAVLPVHLSENAILKVLQPSFRI